MAPPRLSWSVTNPFAAFRRSAGIGAQGRSRLGTSRRRIASTVLFLTLGAGATALTTASAQEGEPETKGVKGKLKGSDTLLNPVWNEAKDPKNNRFTFRQPSATVSKEAKVLTAYLPKEVAIVATGGSKQSGTEKVTISGGRTTPTTIVVATGQNVQFINADPFPHTLYEVKGEQGGLPPEDMKPNTQRTWQPPAAGTYEIRDKRFPSVRSWIVVADDVSAVGYPNVEGDFVVNGLVPGSYTLKAYFAGQEVGSMPVEVKGFAPMIPLPKPLEVSGPEATDKE